MNTYVFEDMNGRIETISAECYSDAESALIERLGWVHVDTEFGDED